MRLMLLALTLMLVGCPDPPPPDDPCEEAKAKYPKCEETGGTWVAFPMRAVDAAESCDCDCGEGKAFVADEGCVDIPPPPPCDGKICVDDCTLNEETCECECPQPPPDKVAQDYLPLSRVGVCDEDCDNATKLCREVCVGRCPWECWRDPEYASVHCAGMIQETFGISNHDMAAFALEGQRLHAQAGAFMLRLDEENEKFDGRSVVLKKNWKKFWSDDIDPETGEEYGAFARHKSRAYEFRAMAQDDPNIASCEPFDSLRGWCTCRNQ